VVIPFLDAGARLSAAVRAVFAQTETRWELLLVDGGSRDRSAAHARALVARHPDRLRLLRRPKAGRLGIFRSRLWAAREARAPLLALLDSDDEWQPRYLERRLAEYRRAFGGGIGLLFGPAIYWRAGSRRAALGVQPTPRPGLHAPGSLARGFLERDYATTPCASGAVLARSIVLEAAPLARRAADNAVEDQYLWSQAALHHPVFVSRAPLFWNRLWSGSTCARARDGGAYRAMRARHERWLLGRLEAA
jgi:glycosyltransferase involved in cell wall biosynthesis